MFVTIRDNPEALVHVVAARYNLNAIPLSADLQNSGYPAKTGETQRIEPQQTWIEWRRAKLTNPVLTRSKEFEFVAEGKESIQDLVKAAFARKVLRFLRRRWPDYEPEPNKALSVIQKILGDKLATVPKSEDLMPGDNIIWTGRTSRYSPTRNYKAFKYLGLGTCLEDNKPKTETFYREINARRRATTIWHYDSNRNHPYPERGPIQSSTKAPMLHHKGTWDKEVLLNEVKNGSWVFINFCVNKAAEDCALIQALHCKGVRIGVFATLEEQPKLTTVARLYTPLKNLEAPYLINIVNTEQKLNLPLLEEDD